MSERYSNRGSERPLGDKDHFNAVADLYREIAKNGVYGTLAPDNRGGRKSRYVASVFDAALLPLIESGASRTDALLDYGCGTGIFAVRAAPLVGEVIGVDVCAEMIDAARRLEQSSKSPSIRWTVSDGQTIPLESASVSWVVARESLCYVPAANLDVVISEIYRVLLPGGKFLWLEQVSDNPKFQTSPSAPLLEKRPAATLIDLARAQGFKLEDAYCVRQPRFPWIYPIWAGLVPERVAETLAAWEVRINKRFGSLSARRWKDALMIFEKR
jgi:SAM-dependent methyltransferase